MADYVTIDLSKKQVDFDKPYVGKDGVERVKILAPDNAVYFYPKASLKQNDEDPNRVYFMRPVDSIIHLQYSTRVEGVPDDAPNDQKYHKEEKDVTIQDLRGMYEAKKDELRAKRQAQNEQYVRMSVPAEWGHTFESKSGDKLVGISLPIHEEEGTVNYYQFIVSAEHFYVNQDTGLGKFSFPRMQKDNPDQDFLVSLQRSVKREDGIYERETIRISSTDLSKEVELAKQAAQKIEIQISAKLVHDFNAKDGTPLHSVAVPVSSEDGETKFYNITVPERNVKKKDNGYGTEVTYLVLPDSDTMSFKATRGVKVGTNPDGSDKWEDEEMKMTPKEIEAHYKESNKRYEAQKQAEAQAQEAPAPSQDVNRHVSHRR